MISADPRYAKKIVEVNGRKMAVVDTGESPGESPGANDPIVFLHGNPTSSYLWRNVMAELEGRGRLIAPDLIGMGDSEKLPDSGPDSYRFVEHREYLDGLLAALGVERNVTLVIHDWGSALGFDWANRHRTAMRGIAYMEAIVRPMSWEEWPEMITQLFRSFRSPAGEEMVLEKNVFVDRVLPGSVMRGLTDSEMEVYRKPFEQAGESRRPTLTWPRQIPLAGEPADVVEIAQSYADWLVTSPLPKLFINAEPGAILVGPQRDFCRTFPNQTEVTVKGTHFIQEDSPAEIGQAIADWLP